MKAASWFARLVVIGVLVWAPFAAVGAGADGPPAGVSGEAWTNIQKQIEAERHRVVESDRPGRLWLADNPSQRFAAHFGSEDVVLIPRSRGEPAWEFGLRLVSWGAAQDLHPVHPANAFSESNRVEYRRGPLTEWYVNTAMGLEQGFTIDAPPVDDIYNLVLEMTLDGDLKAALAASGNAVTFHHEATQITLTYSGLASWDAIGDALEARIELAANGTRLRLVVGIADAAWPITVDPIFTQVAKLLPTPEIFFDNTWFGKCVAVDGDLMVVGLRDDENGSDAGAAYVFQRDQGGADTWGQVARITATDCSAHDSFGYSVSISGDTVIVGAPNGDGNDQSSGSAYVFRRDHGGTGAWGQVAKLIAADGEFFDEFGISVSISGDTAIIGARRDNDQGTDSGSTYVFRRDQGGSDTWGQVTKIAAADGANSDYFGASVAMSGDTAIVGARNDDDNGYDSGSAYVFQRDQGGPDAWGNVAKITASDGEINDLFGYSVAISADTAIVGAHRDDDNGSSSGSTYVFQRHQGGTNAWGRVAKITPADGTVADTFGTSVSISADTAIVGAPYDDDNGSDSGSAYVFVRGQGGSDAWGQVAKITPVGGATEDVFGVSVSISGDTAVVGAYRDDDNGADSGSAYIFQRDQGGSGVWGQITKLTAADGASYEHFGISVAINGDSAIVGAYEDDDNGSQSGSAYVFRRDHGGPNAWGQVAKLTAADGAESDFFGRSVSISGDTAIVGASGDDDNGVASGSTYVFRRNQSGSDAWGQVAKITPADGAETDNFGSSVSVSADTAIAGAPGDDDLGENAGTAYVFNIADTLFVDGFETGDTSGWSATVP
jgi:hypothetical protein